MAESLPDLPPLSDAARLVRATLPRIATTDGLTLRMIREATRDRGLTGYQVVEALDELALHRYIRFNGNRAYWWENDPTAPADYYDRGPYVPSTTVTRFARVLSMARQTAATSELPQLHTMAGFDYGIALAGAGGSQTQLGDAAWDHLQIALYVVANEGHQSDDFEERDARRMALLEELAGEMAKFVDQCRARRYTGWSNAARDRGHPIRYAD